jgi:hypothetical protein
MNNIQIAILNQETNCIRFVSPSEKIRLDKAEVVIGTNRTLQRKLLPITFSICHNCNEIGVFEYT